MSKRAVTPYRPIHSCSSSSRSGPLRGGGPPPTFTLALDDAPLQPLVCVAPAILADGKLFWGRFRRHPGRIAALEPLFQSTSLFSRYWSGSPILDLAGKRILGVIASAPDQLEVPTWEEVKRQLPDIEGSTDAGPEAVQVALANLPSPVSGFVGRDEALQAWTTAG